jgi:hypothetical protein
MVDVFVKGMIRRYGVVTKRSQGAKLEDGGGEREKVRGRGM